MNTQAKPVDGDIDRDLLVREIRYRAQHRGIKELDVTCAKLTEELLQQQADDTLVDLRSLLLQAPDQLLWHWLIDEEPLPTEFAGPGYDLLLALQREQRA